jgi:hypothetical protein
MYPPIQLHLTPQERQQMRRHKIKKATLLDYAPDELAALLQIFRAARP